MGAGENRREFWARVIKSNDALRFTSSSSGVRSRSANEKWDERLTLYPDGRAWHHITGMDSGGLNYSRGSSGMWNRSHAGTAVRIEWRGGRSQVVDLKAAHVQMEHGCVRSCT